MAACRNCGNTISPQQAFCNHCGEKNNSGTPSRAVLNPRFTLSAPIKWVIAAVLVLAVGLFAAHTFLSNYYKPEKTVERFEKLVIGKDYDGLRKVLKLEGTNFNLSKDELKGFTAFLTKDHDFKKIVGELQQEAADINHDKRLDPITDDDDNQLFMLAEGPKKFFLYQQYYIKAYSFTVMAGSSLENTKVVYNGKSKILKKPDEELEIAKVLPGSLTLKAVYNGEYVNLEKETKVDFTKASNNVVLTRLELGGNYVTLYSNGDDADIYANGKKTRLKSGDSFGPVPTDGSVELYAVVNWNGAPIKSMVVKIDREGEVNLPFKEIADEQAKIEARERVMNALASYPGSTPKEQMHYFMDHFLSLSVAAYNNRDFSVVSSYIAPDGPENKEMNDYINVLAKKGITESFLGVEILDMQTTDKGFKVKTREEYDIYYADGTAKRKTFESNYTLVATEFGLQEYKLENTTTINETDIRDYDYGEGDY
ncbi:zinc ribbon domain-containing protein [Neobacillus sp. NPDC058068]|uniref:zinc ribbon domain-containing protein n=1 Tax=Neobacillus sp. NPDC058068 TaxID=3346325 RepID=UPI0036DC65A8